jgi:hypothetical protein
VGAVLDGEEGGCAQAAFLVLAAIDVDKDRLVHGGSFMRGRAASLYALALPLSEPHLITIK